MSTLLAELRDAQAQRAPELAARVAHVIVPRPYLVYIAFCYALGVSSLLAGVVAACNIHFGTAMPSWLTAMLVIAGVGCAVWPFAWWARRRTAPARELGRVGVLVDASIASARERWSRAHDVVLAIEHMGEPLALRVRAGAWIDRAAGVAVLYHPQSPWALYFNSRGDAFSARLHGARLPARAHVVR
jgi:hypothetical protein